MSFEYYNGEADYQSPNTISPEALAKIRRKMGAAALANLK